MTIVDLLAVVFEACHDDSIDSRELFFRISASAPDSGLFFDLASFEKMCELAFRSFCLRYSPMRDDNKDEVPLEALTDFLPILARDLRIVFRGAAA